MLQDVEKADKNNGYLYPWILKLRTFVPNIIKINYGGKYQDET